MKNKQVFCTAQKFYESRGFEVINPLNLHTEDKSWEGYMLTDIKALFKCDEICMLPGWINSKGARIERAISIEMNIKTNKAFHQILNDSRISTAKSAV